MDELLRIANYAVCFLDLLGQKEAMRGQGFIPLSATDTEHEAFVGVLKNSVGRIVEIQKLTDSMLSEMRRDRGPPGPLGSKQLQQWQELKKDNMRTQRWSDGLVHFSCLGDEPISLAVSGVYAQMCTAGAMCLVGLARGAPIRGGMDAAWGVELHPGEIYGAALANAYHQESVCAGFPRIAVGRGLVEYLRDIESSDARDVAQHVASAMAKRCLGMLDQDEDGQVYLHYLSDVFERAVTHEKIEILWGQARNFIESQMELHAQNDRKVLVERYTRLANYFDSHPPHVRRQG